MSYSQDDVTVLVGPYRASNRTKREKRLVLRSSNKVNFMYEIPHSDVCQESRSVFKRYILLGIAFE